ncbi:MAG: hypothetical protein FJ276_05855 [Planctomycetes bacterium]|nr:hypothetical protein [Planctomycetota bacterium]
MTNSIAALGVLGAVLSGVLGFGEAAAKRFAPRSLGMLVIGLVLGAAAGGLAGVLGHWVAKLVWSVDALSALGRTCITHFVTLGVLGAGVGLALGLVRGGRRVFSVVVLCAISGVLAGLIYPVLACAFPKSATELEIAGDALGVADVALPPDVVRTMAYLVPGGVTGVGDKPDVVLLILWTGLLTLSIGLVVPNTGQRRSAATGGS